MPAPAPALWTLTDGAAGNRRQAEALAAALAGTARRDLVLAPRAPWRWLAPRRVPGAARCFDPALAGGPAAAPALAIGCGRQAALATRLLRARGTRTIQLLDPRLSPRHWDLLIVPEHDRLRGENVLTVRGSLHPIDDAWLAAARATWAPRLAGLPAPRTGLLLGGPIAQVPWTPADLDALLDGLAAEARASGASLLVTGSRRTPAWAVQAVHARLGSLPGLRWFGAHDGENPYPGILACCDRLVVGADSVNLLSEAAATHATLHAAFASRAAGRHADFLAALRGSGRLDGLDAAPLRELPRAAAWVRERLGLGDPPSPTATPVETVPIRRA
ncbi:mitochondrial fission ELM1 family protein [Coralloluteibacterium thermophilus]|uniref:Mitochondrial fission ELM1 family protein n=1 Tax=Coralloluteibacterium thermophilum TaxID=2707049 RepID=A0ABV9NJC4_9GAMM